MVWRSRCAALFLLAPAALCACTSTAPVSQVSGGQFLANEIPAWAGGETTGTPKAPAAAAYPNVFDEPAQRHAQTLTTEQQKKAAADLNSLRSNVDAKLKSARAFDEQNTANAVTETTKGQIGQIDEPVSNRVR
jgi:hypothetical protein